MEAHRRRPGMLEGLSRFLVQHERCGAGFDVAHPAGLGSGRVSITCRGCGARHEYATATIEIERELRIEPAAEGTEEPAARRPEPAAPAPPPERPAAIPPRPAPYPDSTPRPEAPARSGATQRARAAGPAASAGAGKGAVTRRGAERVPQPPAAESAMRRFWRSPRAILTLVVAAAVGLGFGVVWLLNEIGGLDTPPTQPVTAPPPAVAPEPEPLPPGPVGSPVPGATPPATTTLRTERFTVEVPLGWSKRTADGGLLLEPRGGGRANVQIFYQRSPGLSSSRMAQQTTDFIAGEVPGASLFPNRIQIDGRGAYELTARGPGETAIAVNVLRGPYRYLLVRRIFAGAKPRTSQAAGRIVLSFSPR